MAIQLLSDLPAELLLRVGEHLDLADCRSLSSVNSQFRRFLGPTLFNGLRATNRNEGFEIIESLISKYARHIHKLHFELHMTEENGDGSHTYAIDSTPPIVWELLSRRALSNVSTLRITFRPHPEDFNGGSWNDEGLGGSIYINDDEESLEDVIEKEASIPWRALFNRTLQTITSDSNSLKRLELWNLPPKSASVQASPEWRATLNGLEEFELNLWGGDNGAGWHSNTVQGYLDSIDALGPMFFEHLTSAKRVKLISDAENPIGCEGMRQTSIPFRPNDLPMVEHLELQDCFVDRALMACLKKSPGRLKSLRLINCHSAGDANNWGTADEATPWADFFACLRHSHPNLQDFTIEEDRPPPLTHDEQFYGAWNTSESSSSAKRTVYPPPDDEPEDVREVRRLLKEQPGRRLFNYSTLDDKYGMVFAYEEVNILAFVQGDDQREFDLLMAMVEENQGKAKEQ